MKINVIIRDFKYRDDAENWLETIYNKYDVVSCMCVNQITFKGSTGMFGTGGSGSNKLVYTVAYKAKEV